MTNNWIKALKEYNKDNTEIWCVPKKGSKNYLKIKKIADRYEKKEKGIQSQDQAIIKIQSLVRGVQSRQKQKKEYVKQALEKYKHLIPQNTIADMKKPNKEFLGSAEYLRNRMNEDFLNKKKMEAIAKYRNLIPQNTISNMMKPR